MLSTFPNSKPTNYGSPVVNPVTVTSNQCLKMACFIAILSIGVALASSLIGRFPIFKKKMKGNFMNFRNNGLEKSPQFCSKSCAAQSALNVKLNNIHFTFAL